MFGLKKAALDYPMRRFGGRSVSNKGNKQWKELAEYVKAREIVGVFVADRDRLDELYLFIQELVLSRMRITQVA